MKSADQNKWTIGPVEHVFNARVFDLCKRHVVTDTGHTADYYFLNSPDWVNVVPITPDNQVVLIKQFRASVREYCLEIPGGLVNSPEEPRKEAAMRELLEETGYSSTEVTPLGVVSPNPAIFRNSIHYFVARNCAQTSATSLEPCEDISIVLTPLQELPKLVREGKINHGVMIPAFLKLFIAEGLLR